MESFPLPSSSPSSIPALPPPPKRLKRLSAVMIVTLLLVGLLAGGLIGYSITYSDFNQKLSNLQSQIGLSQSSGNGSQQTFILNDNVSLSSLYLQVKSSVVVIQDLVPTQTFFRGTAYSLQQGSGFITAVSYTHLRAHETDSYLVCRLLLEK